MKKNRKKVVVVINPPVEKKDPDFAKALDEIASYAGPSVVWAGVESKVEVIALAVFGYILCKAWAARLRRLAK